MPETIEIRSRSGECYYALVDAENYAELSKYKWHPQVTSSTVYARRGSGGRIQIHRVVLGLPFISPLYVDHIDGNGLNNQKSNLRVCDNTQNQANAVSRRGASKFKGVYWRSARQIWVASICVNLGWWKHREYLGSFENELDAAKAYNRRALEVHGEFARLNDVGE